jgi:basic amino acid/polyamine antiporter, APA family
MHFNDLFRKKSISKIIKDLNEHPDHQNALNKTLTARDLTAFGIAAIIGAGIFSTIGQASADGGPGVIFLFIFTAIACSFAAFCYAEFASMVPASGSAYTYSYVAFGELAAWIIGWALIMEYAIGNITVAISWSDYFTSLMKNMGWNIPMWAQMDYFSAYRGHSEAELLMHSGKSFENLDEVTRNAYTAWQTAPSIMGLHFVTDLPALLIIVLITWLVYRGIKETRNASNIMVLVKLAVVVLVICVGMFYVQPENWNPFMPNGTAGVLKGVSAVFFAYIGFDAISTTAEECKDPQRDLPKGMMWSIIICTILYVAIALVLTGMVKYNTLAVGDPLAFVFEKYNLRWLSGIIGVSAVFAMASVLLVFQLGQPRIWMSMSRDGLLPSAFSRIHPRFLTPSFATIVTGFVVAIPTLFLNLTMVTDLCSIGTLFAFILVCGGILMLQNKKDLPRGKFRTPYLNAKFIYPVLVAATLALLWVYNPQPTKAFIFNEAECIAAEDVVPNLTKGEIDVVKSTLMLTDSLGIKAKENDLEAYLSDLSLERYKQTLQTLSIPDSKKYVSGWNLFKHKVPMWIFILTCLTLAVLAFLRNLSLIPILGVISCLYMMAQIELKNWIGFTIWLIIGLVIYFSYGRWNSRLAKTNK